MNTLILIFVIPAVLWGLVAIPMIIMSIIMMKGYGADWIAGYNTMDKKEQAKYDEKALCRFTGQFTLILTLATTITIPIDILTGTIWLSLCVIPAIIIGGLVYANTGNRFLRKGEVVVVEETASEKATREKMEWYAIIALGILLCLIPLATPVAMLLIVFFLPR